MSDVIKELKDSFEAIIKACLNHNITHREALERIFDIASKEYFKLDKDTSNG